MGTEQFPVVRGEHDDRVLGQAGGLQGIEDAGDGLIHHFVEEVIDAAVGVVAWLRRHHLRPGRLELLLAGRATSEGVVLGRGFTNEATASQGWSQPAWLSSANKSAT